MTTSELALNCPALFKTSAMDLTLAIVPLHFQFPPISALAIFEVIFVINVEFLFIVDQLARGFIIAIYFYICLAFALLTFWE